MHNIEDIPRFNQGFGGFGPLEQATEGKLMKAEDILPVLTKQEQDIADYKSWLSFEEHSHEEYRAMWLTALAAASELRISLHTTRALLVLVVVLVTWHMVKYG